MKSASFAAVLSTSLVFAVPANANGWATASDVGRDALVGAALLVPAVQGDWHGDIATGGSMLVTEGITFGLKHAIHEERPDHSDNKSFPSGHASLSFAAAASLEKRYGWQAGLPAFAVASFVGVSRVEARKHHWWDAVAGAGIGTTTGLLLTPRTSSEVQLLPFADTSGGGVGLAARF